MRLPWQARVSGRRRAFFLRRGLRSCHSGGYYDGILIPNGCDSGWMRVVFAAERRCGGGVMSRRSALLCTYVSMVVAVV